MGLPKKAPLPSSKQTGDSRPFGVLWLDSLFQEIFLPNGAWQKVLLKVNNSLADNIRKQFDHAERKQMIFELMGDEYVQANFPQEQFNPNSILPPAISIQERKKLQVDAQNWLQKEMAKVTAEVGCQRPMPGANQAEPSEEMQDFLRFVRYLATRNMNRHLHLQEKEVMRAWENYQWEQTEAKQQEKEIREQVRLKREYERLTGTTPNPRSILRSGMTPFSNKPPPTAGSMSSDASSKTTANIKGAIFGASDDPPTFWGMQSNSVGRSIVSILKRDPRRYGEVASRLHGRQLPSTLRMYLWLDMLLRQERERLREGNVEKLVRERFGKALSRGIGDLKVKRATHSPISGLIDNAVIEIYDSTPGMRMFLEYDQHMKEAAKALNILYVYDRTYEPYLIYWLFPIQMAFQDFSGQSEHVYDLAMYLDLLNKSCFPKWPAVFAVAERVMTRLETVDKELHDHLESISLINVNINPKEFLVQLIHEEKAKAQELLADLPNRSLQVSKDLLANPRIFLRKWVGEGFASVLDTQAVLYVWDQCFMMRWDTQVLEDFCIVLLLLLRHKFLEADEYKEMRRVFQREPCKLYTMDIQRAWIHVQRNGDHDHVHPMNRQAYKVKHMVAASPVHAAYSPMAGSPQPSILTAKPVSMIGLKHLRLDVDIPAENLYTIDVNPSAIKLQCKLYFGSVHISTKTSTVTPTSTGVKIDKYGAKSFHAGFPKQKFIFDSFDSAQYDLEEEMGGYPYAVIQVTCDVTESRRKTSVPLGWARIKLFQNKADIKNWTDPTNVSQWMLVAGDLKQRLSSGEAPEAGVTGTSQQTPSKPLIGQNSWLNSLVFDPSNEPLTPNRSPSPVALPKTPPPPTPKSKTPTPKLNTPTPSPRHTPSPRLPGIKDKFILYVDGVDNIPDNATITKVTGRFVKTGSLTGLQDILAMPVLESRARCPRFTYRYVTNEAEVESDVNMMVLLRLYTVDRMSGELQVVGSCLCPVFNQQTGKVQVGGHQKMLHYGMPDLKKGLAALSSSSLDASPRVPGCTVYYRFTRFTQDVERAPNLDFDHYPIDDKGYNKSEQQVMHSYQADNKHPKTTDNMITLLQRLEKVQSSGMNSLVWLEDRLDQKTRLPANQAAGYLDLAHMVHYRLDKGINVYISHAYGLPEGLYVQCFARVYAGDQVQGQQVTEAGHGRDDEKIITLKTDLDSQQTAPHWMDGPKKINPHWDINTFLLVQLFGLSIKYTANSDHKNPGKLTDKKGEELKIGPENIIGWTMVPLFNDMYTHTGEHHVPLFKGQPDQEILTECTKKPVADVLKDHPNYHHNKLDFASLEVSIWDGHFLETELLEPPKRQDSLLEVVSSVDQYKKVERETKGDKIHQFVLDGLTKKERKPGTSGQAYFKEKVHFVDTIETTFSNLMDVALLEAGYGPL